MALVCLRVNTTAVTQALAEAPAEEEGESTQYNEQPELSFDTESGDEQPSQTEFGYYQYPAAWSTV